MLSLSNRKVNDVSSIQGKVGCSEGAVLGRAVGEADGDELGLLVGYALG
jgi:hypothetical protein